jgi:hypothetical protein
LYSQLCLRDFAGIQKVQLKVFNSLFQKTSDRL